MARNQGPATAPDPIDRPPPTPAPERQKANDPASFGAYLRARREARQQTLQQVADVTKIATRHLQSLERGDIRYWPGGMYRRAMIRAYAQAIGLGVKETVGTFLEIFPDQPETSPMPVDVPARPDRQGTRARRYAASVVAIAGAVAAALLLAGWYAASYIRSAVNFPRPSPPQATPAEPNARATPSPTLDSVVDNTATLAGTSGTARQEIGTVTAANDDVMTASAQDAGNASAQVEGELRVQSDPDGAQVTVNGIGWGRTPVTIKYLPMGEKRVRLSKDGYQSVERRIEITAERPVRPLRVTLRQSE
jgi:cytoskeletal protein RodZ